ncbi:MAG: hypothetical protein ACREGL_10260 [Alphaproteobacteria bacterium]
MTVEEMVERLRRARALVAEVTEGTDLPQVQMTLWQADMNLHWAIWNLGEFDGLRHDLPPERNEP